MAARARRPASEILSNVRTTLAHARDSLDDFLGTDPKRQDAGLRNFIVTGRQVTFVLQNLRGVVDDFDDWYSEIQARLRVDEVAQTFVELRNLIEKQGVLDTTHAPASTLIRNLSTDDLARLVPAHAVSVVIGEGRSGGNYWVDRGGRRHYFALPGHVENRGGSRFSSAPESLSEKSIEELAHLYLEQLEQLVVAAMLRFGQLP